MKTFRELYFKGTPQQLSTFVDQIGEYAVEDWEMVRKTERSKDYLLFDYNGDLVDKARISIYVGDRIAKGELSVGNIVPERKAS